MATATIPFPITRRPPIIWRPGNLHDIATEAEDALLKANAPFYIRGGIVRPIVDTMPASRNHMTKAARLRAVDSDTLIDHLSRAATWMKMDGRKGVDVPIDPPAPVAATILSRDGEWRFPRLAGVITTPTLRPDGSILSQAGYDAATQLLLLDPPSLPTIPDRPSRNVALNALAMLDSLLDEFPFVDGPSRSAALSALITPVVRGALQTVPMHATTAPAPGSRRGARIRRPLP